MNDRIPTIERALWQPIETAPGPKVIVDLWIEGERSEVEFYCPDPIEVAPGRFAGRTANAWLESGRWRPVSGMRRYPIDATVSILKWRPLPEPPG